MHLELTKTEVLADIQAYQDRITLARVRLDSLPASASTWNEKKKLEGKRRTLRHEIELVRKLIAIAEENLIEFF